MNLISLRNTFSVLWIERNDLNPSFAAWIEIRSDGAFLKSGYTSSHHPFIDGIFPNKKPFIWGCPLTRFFQAFDVPAEYLPGDGLVFRQKTSAVPGQPLGEMLGAWKTGWWFGCHQFYFPRNIGNVIIPIDELIFFRGVAQPPTRKCWSMVKTSWIFLAATGGDFTLKTSWLDLAWFNPCFTWGYHHI